MQREDVPERKHYALDVPGVTEQVGTPPLADELSSGGLRSHTLCLVAAGQRRRILGWPEEWGGEEGQLTGAGLMFQPPKL